MHFLKKLKSTQSALLALANTLFLSLSSPAMASEMALDNLLNSMINSAIEATKDQLTEAIENTLENTQLFDEVEPAKTEIVVLNPKPVLPVDATATE